MIQYLQNQKFRQRLELIELTKQLEREPCDSLSFTHRLQKNLFPYSSYVPAIITGDSDNLYPTGDINSLYITPNAANQNICYIQANRGATNDTSLWITVYDGNGQSVYQSGQILGSTIAPTGTNLTSLILADGNYVIEYHFNYSLSTPGIDINYNTYVNYQIVIKSDVVVAKPIPSITDVINRILNVGLPRDVSTQPKYHLDPVIAAKFANTPAPEFFLPRMTLFEALLTVGHYIHAIPRLVFNEETQKADTITYDLLGVDDEYVFPQNCQIVGYKNIQNADDYCGAIDSYAENLVNTIDPAAGSVTEQWKTLRTMSGQQINNESAVYETEKPIYRIVKVEMGYTEASQSTMIGDITDYVYEQSEYDGLFVDKNATYPNSVTFALCWQQGSRFIKGFNTASRSLLNIIQRFAEPSIVNIANRVRSGSMGTGEIYGNLAFRVTYIPMDNVRVRQYKPYTGFPNDNALYNQQNANTVEANYYGENLKGKIARLGNEIQVYTVRYKDIRDLPALGNVLADDNELPYVYKITTRRGRTFSQADIYATKDFNKLSEYFGLNSNFRLYEVSERQSIDRQVMVSRYIRISFTEPQEQIFGLMKDNGIRRFMDTFTQKDPSTETPLSGVDHRTNAKVCAMKLLDDQGNQIGDICFAKSVSSTAVGNSIAFSWGFEDSYSAGYRSTYAGGYQWKQQKASPYGGVYGTFYAMNFFIGANIYRNGSPLQLAYSDQKTDGFCDKLPTLDTSLFDNSIERAFFRTADLTPLGSINTNRVIDKNSSEKLSFTLQFHGQADDKRIVMGSLMWKNNLLIKDSYASKPQWYALVFEKISMLRSKIDLSTAIPLNATATVSYVSSYNGYGKLNGVTNSTIGAVRSVALCDPNTGELYIGINKILQQGERAPDIYFYMDQNF